MHQDRVPGLDGVTAAEQELRRHPLEEDRRSDPGVHVIRQRHRPISRHAVRFGIGPERSTGVADAVPDLEAGHARSDRVHHARGFHT
jgi:hypothetical protein